MFSSFLKISSVAKAPRPADGNVVARLPGTRNDIEQSRRAFSYPVERIDTLALLIRGTADEAVPFAHAQSLVSRLPNAELLTLQGGRHVSLFTHLDLIRPCVRQFLEAHAGTSAVH